MKHIHSFQSFLNEAFADKHGKNVYAEISRKDVEEYAEDIVELIRIAYQDKGGNLEIKNASDLKQSDITYWVAKDIDDEPDADIAIGGKPTPHGVKITIMGQDGSRDARKDASIKMIALMKTRGFYAEMDKDLAQKFGLSPIRNEREIRNVLNKDIVYHNDGSYDRDIAGSKHTKVLVGIPK